MKELLVVYHTQSGATGRLAKAAFDGARTEDACQTTMLTAFEAGVPELRRADGVVFCTPENFGYVSGGMKDFLDRTFYALHGTSTTRAYALIVSAGNDGSGAVRQMQRILRGYPMREIAEALIVRGPPSAQSLSRAREIGETMAAGLAMGIF